MSPHTLLLFVSSQEEPHSEWTAPAVSVEEGLKTRGARPWGVMPRLMQAACHLM